MTYAVGHKFIIVHNDTRHIIAGDNDKFRMVLSKWLPNKKRSVTRTNTRPINISAHGCKQFRHCYGHMRYIGAGGYFEEWYHSQMVRSGNSL